MDGLWLAYIRAKSNGATGMKRFVARCDCGKVSEVPHEPTVAPDKVRHDGKTGRCSSCGRAVSTANGWWHNMDDASLPKAEIDLLEVV